MKLLSSINGLGLILSSVTADTVYAREAALPLDAFNVVIPPPSIAARQFNDSTSPVDSIPQQCRDRCSVLNDAVTTCRDAPCICTEDNAKRYADCMNCVLATNPTDAHENVLQHIYDLYKSECDSQNHPVPKADIGADAGDNDGAMRVGGGTSIILAVVVAVLGALNV